MKSFNVLHLKDMLIRAIRNQNFEIINLEFKKNNIVIVEIWNFNNKGYLHEYWEYKPYNLIIKKLDK